MIRIRKFLDETVPTNAAIFFGITTVITLADGKSFAKVVRGIWLVSIVRKTTDGTPDLWGAHEDEAVRSLEAYPLQGTIVRRRPPADAQADELLPLRQDARLFAENFLVFFFA